MENKSLLNKQFGVDEYSACINHLSNMTNGFRYIEFHEGMRLEEKFANKNYLLFFLKGKFIISCNQFCGRKFSNGEMVLLSKSSTISIEVESYSQLLIMAFDMPESNCDKLTFQSLSSICKELEYNLNSLPIRYPLILFIETLTSCLNNKMNRTELNEIMQQEFFFLLRGFYDKKEIATLFYPFIGRELSFKDFVIRSYPEVNNIDELITLSNMGRTSFFIKFKEEFGITAKQWMLKQMRERILGKITEPGVCVKQLLDVCKFESQAQLYRYFKQQFQCTPKELIERYQSGN